MGRNEDGQEDFRGFPLSRFGRVLQTKFKDCDFADADFSNSRIESCTFESCNFFGTDFSSFHDEHNRFLDCQFVKADFRKAAIGFGTSEYSNCTFKDCNFVKAIFANAIFEGVSFFQDFKRIDFNASGFWNCAFFGKLHDVWFKGDYQSPLLRGKLGVPKRTGLHDTSFTKANLFGITTSNECAVERLMLPDDITVCDGRKLLSDLDVLGSDFSHNEWLKVSKYLNVLKVHLPTQRLMLLDKKEMAKMCGPGVGQKLFEIVRAFGVADN